MPVHAADETQPLCAAEGSAKRRPPGAASWAAVWPTLPLLVFLGLILLVPLGIVVKTAFQDKEIATALPRTSHALADWSGQGAPADAVYALLAQELGEARRDGTLRALARRTGYEFERGSNLIMKTARALSAGAQAAGSQTDLRAALLAVDPAWGQPGIWRVIQSNAGSWSWFYLRWALGVDVMRSPQGTALQNATYDFRRIYLRTIAISLTVTALTVLIGYPIAYVATTAAGITRTLLLFLVLLPFWTSLLVRTLSWIVVLQKQGVVNDVLVSAGLLAQPATLLYTSFATLTAMVQIQLPFTVLPMITVMRAIAPSHVRAARSLGASALRAHVNVFLPQAVPGIAAGALLTFVLCLGFYITPALVGGAGDQMISAFIARFTNEELNWGLASALSLVLMTGAAVLAVPLSRHIGAQAAGRF